MTAAVNCFEVEAMSKTDAGPIGAPRSRSACP